MYVTWSTVAVSPTYTLVPSVVCSLTRFECSFTFTKLATLADVHSADEATDAARTSYPRIYKTTSLVLSVVFSFTRFEFSFQITRFECSFTGHTVNAWTGVHNKLISFGLLLDTFKLLGGGGDSHTVNEVTGPKLHSKRVKIKTTLKTSDDENYTQNECDTNLVHLAQHSWPPPSGAYMWNHLKIIC